MKKEIQEILDLEKTRERFDLLHYIKDFTFEEVKKESSLMGKFRTAISFLK